MTGLVLERIVAGGVLVALTGVAAVIGYALNSQVCAERRRRRFRRINRHNPATCRVCVRAGHPSRSSLAALEGMWASAQ